MKIKKVTAGIYEVENNGIIAVVQNICGEWCLDMLGDIPRYFKTKKYAVRFFQLATDV